MTKSILFAHFSCKYSNVKFVRANGESQSLSITNQYFIEQEQLRPLCDTNEERGSDLKGTP
jgi:hypothetical protein